MRLNPKTLFIIVTNADIICTADASNDRVDSIVEVTASSVCSYRLSFIFIKMLVVFRIAVQIHNV